MTFPALIKATAFNLALITAALSGISAYAGAAPEPGNSKIVCTPKSHDFAHVTVSIERSPMRAPIYLTTIEVAGEDDSAKKYGGSVLTIEQLTGLQSGVYPLPLIGIGPDTIFETPERMRGAVMLTISNLGDAKKPVLEANFAVGGLVYTLNCK